MRIQTSIKHHGFLMPLAAIKENDWDLSINRFKEMVHEEVVYVAPNEIIERINSMSIRRKNLLESLKSSI
jgi:type I restriction enzyme M protein